MRKNYVSQAVHELRECPSCHKRFVSNTAAHIYCTRECYFKTFWVTGGIYSTQENKEAEIKRRVSKKYSQFEYVGGYTGADGYIYIQCKDCASVFRKSNQNLKAAKEHQRWECPNCSAVQRELKLKAEKAEKLQKYLQERTEHKKIRFWSQQFEQQTLKTCAKCGSLFLFGRKYCSKKCMNSAQNERKSDFRRIRVEKAMVDNDITLEKLFNRDKGFCYICGNKCNFDDSAVVNGAFIAGDTYPTKEHVIPLSRGGLHSWDNVKLACFKCNTEKRDKTYEEFQENKRRNRKSS